MKMKTLSSSDHFPSPQLANRMTKQNQQQSEPNTRKRYDYENENHVPFGPLCKTKKNLQQQLEPNIGATA
jgi:hypothetical protein